MEGQLQTAMKAVGQAIKLDDEGQDREAYYRYLACTQFISQGILEDSKNQEYRAPIKTTSTVRMLKLAQHCVDRAVAIMEKTDEQMSNQLSPPPADQSGRFSPSIQHVQQSQPSPPPKPTPHPRPRPAGQGSMPHRVPQQGPKPSQNIATLPVPSGYSRPKAGRKDKLTPLEAAYLENQRLMNSYRGRLAQVMENSKGKGRHNKTTLNLTLQRRLMENLAIARAREAALAKKIQERHSRLQEEAVSRFSTTGEPTRAEIELRQIYASVMEFENNEDWLTEWRRKLHESPCDLGFIHALIGHILACADHPFTQLLQKFQYSIYQSLLPLVQKDSEELEQIQVPYKAVEPLQLSDAKARVIPPDGFSTPEGLDKESLDEDLLRRLQALRNSSSEERRESLYSNMLATSPNSTSFLSGRGDLQEEDDEEDDGMWDSGDDTLEDPDLEPGPRKAGDIALGPDTSADSQASALPEASPIASGLGPDENRDSADRERPDNSAQDLPSVPVGPPSISLNGGAVDVDIEGEPANTGIGDPDGSNEEGSEDRGVGGDDDDDDEEEEEVKDVLGQMRRLTTEVQEDLREAAAEGKEWAAELVRNSEEEEEVVREARTEPDGEVGEDTERRDSELEPCLGDDQHSERGSSGDDDTGEVGKSLNCERERLAEQKEDGVKEGEEEEKEERRAKEEEQERIARLQEEALQRHLKHISKDIQSYLDRLQSLLVAIYEDLDSAMAKEQCIAIIEKHFFRLIWQPLLTLYRRANFRKEISAATAMTRYQNALPENIGIIKKLCLKSDEEVEGQADSYYPYQLAVEELRRISSYFSPLEKLECVVKASRAIISCVGDYYEAHGESRENTENAVGCDDLLPILSFVVIKSALPHIVSECSIMEEFIHEGYLFGEEGYCLTTLQTSLGYVLKLAED